MASVWNYDDTVLDIKPDELLQRGDRVKALNQDIADSLTNINNALSNLQLGWAGQTADEAKAFGDRWQTVMGELFGSQDNPEGGVLNAIVVGILQGRAIYSLTEVGIAEFFWKFSEALAGGTSDNPPPATTPTSPPDSITDPNVTAISEQF